LILIFIHSPNKFCINSRSFFRNSIASHLITVTYCCLCFRWITSNCSSAIFFLVYLLYSDMIFMPSRITSEYNHSPFTRTYSPLKSVPVAQNLNRLTLLIDPMSLLPPQVSILYCLDEEDTCEFQVCYRS
jgi:hypothetical protein